MKPSKGFTWAALPGHWFGPPTVLLRVYCDLAPDKNEHLHHEFRGVMLDQAPPSMEKVVWVKAIQIGNQVSKQATIAGMLWNGESPDAKQIEETMKFIFQGAAGLPFALPLKKCWCRPNSLSKHPQLLYESKLYMLRQRMTDQLINGVDYMHSRSFLHRDINPDMQVLTLTLELSKAGGGFPSQPMMIYKSWGNYSNCTLRDNLSKSWSSGKDTPSSEVGIFHHGIPHGNHHTPDSNALEMKISFRRRIWHLTRKKKQLEWGELQRLAKRKWERELVRNDATEDLVEDLSERDKGDAFSELISAETPRKTFQRDYSNLEVEQP
ncbi:hypothetical protein F3Y22_tig00110926pilonHSYRG00028 [Hibiscus syriacus]|uniref:Protein kinase domain-containing protein n=1 Tax=Hibiscus syriacus TaxID=106335 RepID=A0A6A2ZEZ8_HIBSY|nr:hypothetical protein F3Y22_tig00110926pilonHSYRG00028 [Hibiscus syriacus]